VLLATLLVGVVLLGLRACNPPGHRPPWTEPPAEATAPLWLEAEPSIRVRVADGVREATVRAEGAVVVRIAGSPRDARQLRFEQGVTITWTGDGFELRSVLVDDGYRWQARALELEAAPAGGEPRLADADAPAALKLGDRAYPGVIVVAARPAAGAFDLINRTTLERYLPGVLASELYHHWAPAAFEAQAVAARSYALWTLLRRERYDFDVEATQASQVYRGRTELDRAVNATLATRGVVLTHDHELVRGYYSSCCGGITQDAAEVFPQASDMPPLRGVVTGDWCDASPRFVWGPVERDRDALSARLRAWGAARGRPIARLGRITRITVAAANGAGRPTRYAVADDRGGAFELDAEAMRLACNYAGSTAPPLPSEHRLHSAFVDAVVDGPAVRFEGRGFGHGVGLCQWGAQGQAMADHNATQILATYYAGAALRQVYR